MSSKQPGKGKHPASIGRNSPPPSPTQMSPVSDSTLEFTWHQYCAKGEGLGVELERICLAVFAYQSGWGLLTVFLDIVRGTEHVILSRPKHSCISKNHSWEPASQTWWQSQSEHLSRARLAVEGKMGLGTHLLRTGEVALELDNRPSATHSVLPSTHLALSWHWLLSPRVERRLSSIHSQSLWGQYSGKGQMLITSWGNHAQNIKLELNLGISLYSNKLTWSPPTSD